MSAQSVYLKVTRISLRSASNLSKRRVDELNSGIGELRRLLSCVVCCQLLMDPYSPKGKRCQHNVCRLCLRGKKRLFPSCPQCEGCSDFKTYEENRTIALLLLCYKTLCVHLLQSSLFAQLAGLRPQMGARELELLPRIKLPPKSTQEFIREGSNYDDMRDTFLPQPDLPFLKGLPSSLPAETPPTTAATTPEIPYEQHLPEHHQQLSISDIELEAAATAEQGHFSPLPLLPTGSRMGLQAHTAQVIFTSGNTDTTESGFMEQAWTGQVDLSEAISVPSFPSNNTNFTVSYLMPAGASTPFDAQELHIGQVVQIGDSSQTAVLTAVEEPLRDEEEEAVLQGPEENEEGISQLNVLAVPEEPEGLAVLSATEDLEEPEQLALLTVTEGPEELAVLPVKGKPEELTLATVAQESEELTVLSGTKEPKEPVKVKSGKRKLDQIEEDLVDEEHEDKVDEIPKKVVKEAKKAEPEGPVTRKRARSPKIPVQKIEAENKSEPATQLQSAKSAFRRVRGKEDKDKERPPKSKCRCGIAKTANPLTTCRTSRCPCYKNGNSCNGCNCVSCKNPHKVDFMESDDEDGEEAMKSDEEKDSNQQKAMPAPQEEKSADATPETAAPALVPVSNLQQSKHKLVLVLNENGVYQGFNIFQGSKPLDPESFGYVRVPLHNNDGNSSLPQYAYIMPPATPAGPAPSPPPPPPPPPAPEREVLEPPPKKFRTGCRTRRGMANFSALDTVDELVSGGSTSNSAAGDRLSATDNAHSLFEEIMSGSDDLGILHEDFPDFL
ncbi:E3 ubiquitin-protein ligase msl-2 isoform X1 [Drosophila kikkawai]|uniref:E3 ubiquitin-protein ligase msl-2 isoform X1 n=2 Tax=Drosophila kikkawai TaxID=30033 RepID=A0A6P4ICK5_DROKI|nr:E3 ubiquitin-protein ligase msl-2 isoform X1 [Drosophila kikkawai]